MEGFQTKSIVEKGVWEEIFSLGDGHLHLKLQFILNDEERDRIRMMVLSPSCYTISLGF